MQPLKWIVTWNDLKVLADQETEVTAESKYAAKKRFRSSNPSAVIVRIRLK